MVLSFEDATLFYQLYRPLLEYAKKRLPVDQSLILFTDNPSRIHPQAFHVSQALWKHTEVIDEYLAEHQDLPEEHQKIIAGWKRAVAGTFALQCYLRSGSVFILEKGYGHAEAYLVQGIISSMQELVSYRKPPFFLDTALLPFKNVIIFEGTMVIHNVFLGPGIRSSLKDAYADAVRNGRFYTSLQSEAPAPKKAAGKGTKGTGKKGTKAKSEVVDEKYTLKVYPDGFESQAWRVLEFSGRRSLDDLCSAILSSFDFTHEHLYEFCMSKNVYGEDTLEYDPDHPRRSGTRVSLNSLGLFKGQDFYLHYDYFDDWLFTIHVQDMETVAGEVETSLIQSKGKVEQHPKDK